MALGLTQGGLADLLGISRRTVSRWDAGERDPSNEQLHQIARAIFPRDGELAAGLAAEGGTTLEGLGLVPRPAPPPPAPPAPPTPPARAFPPVGLMIDSILLSAIEAAEGQRASLRERDAIREVLRAAFARARALGLTLDEVDEALSPRPPALPVRARKPTAA